MRQPIPSIEATIDLTAAARTAWDVVVIGAGPAGALAARQLALAGPRVLLVDKARFPRDKVCGCCLNAAALGVLSRVGLEHLPASCGARPLQAVRVWAGRTGAWLDLPASAAVSRAALDAALVRAAIAAGGEFLPGCLATAEPGATVTLRSGSTLAGVSADATLIADGLAGRAADAIPGLTWRVAKTSRIGCGVTADDAPRAYGPGTIHMAVARGGYVGLVRIEDNRVDIAAAFDPKFVRSCGGPGAAASCILASAGLPAVEGLAEAPWKGTPALTRQRRRLQAGSVFVIGDAAGYVEPFTGEGIAWALASAEACVPLVARVARHGAPSDADEWTLIHRGMLGARQRSCRVVAWALRRPAVAGAAIRALALAPALAAPVVRTINRMHLPPALPVPSVFQ